MKGGKVLSASTGCHALKMSCKTGVNTAIGRKQGEKLEATVIVEEEAEVPGQVDTRNETEEILGRAHRPPRSAAVWARAHLDKYCKLHTSVRVLADTRTVPASVLLRRKNPATEAQPASWK